MAHAPLGQGAKKVKLPAKAQNKTAAASGEALLPCLRELPPALRQAARDNGSETAWFMELERAGLMHLLCRSHSPWQCGTNDSMHRPQ